MSLKMLHWRIFQGNDLTLRLRGAASPLRFLRKCDVFPLNIVSGQNRFNLTMKSRFTSVRETLLPDDYPPPDRLGLSVHFLNRTRYSQFVSHGRLYFIFTINTIRPIQENDGKLFKVDLLWLNRRYYLITPHRQCQRIYRRASIWQSIFKRWRIGYSKVYDGLQYWVYRRCPKKPTRIHFLNV